MKRQEDCNKESKHLPLRVVHEGVSKRVWICDACNKREIWGPGWRWYGSLADEDDGHIPRLVCSDECAAGGRR